MINSILFFKKDPDFIAGYTAYWQYEFPANTSRSDLIKAGKSAEWLKGWESALDDETDSELERAA